MFNKIRYKIKYFFQRRIRGFDDTDLWGLDDHLIKLILPRLKAFRNGQLHSYPSGIAEDFGVPEMENGHAGFSVWLQVLSKMIWSMEHWVETGGMPGYEGTSMKFDQVLYDKWQEGMDLFLIYFHALWD